MSASQRTAAPSPSTRRRRLLLCAYGEGGRRSAGQQSDGRGAQPGLRFSEEATESRDDKGCLAAGVLFPHVVLDTVELCTRDGELNEGDLGERKEIAVGVALCPGDRTPLAGLWILHEDDGGVFFRHRLHVGDEWIGISDMHHDADGHGGPDLPMRAALRR